MKNEKELTEKELIEICSKHYFKIKSNDFLEKVRNKITLPIKKEIKAAFPVGMQILKKNKKYLTSDLMQWCFHKNDYTLLTLQKLSFYRNKETLGVRFHFVDENFTKVLSNWYSSGFLISNTRECEDFIKDLYTDLALDFKILK